MSYGCSLSKNTSKMLPRVLYGVLGIFCPTGMPHRIAQQPIVWLIVSVII